jgi:hypothetical protein
VEKIKHHIDFIRRVARALLILTMEQQKPLVTLPAENSAKVNVRSTTITIYPLS